MKVPGLRGAIYLRGDVWWVKYYQHGRPIRERTGSTEQRDAEKLLLKRNAEIQEGRTVNPRVNRCKVDELLAMVVTDYEINKQKSIDGVRRRIKKHLAPTFGGRKAASISSDDLTRFVAKRQNAGAANGEINRELALLRRAFNLGRKAEKIDRQPPFDMLAEDNVREGFFERAEFESVAGHLSADLAAAFRFAYVTGWRIHSEVLNLQWRQVDFQARTLRLDAGKTKNKKGRTFKFTTELQALLEAQDAHTRAVQRDLGRVVPWVFHRGGKPIRDFYRAWRSACLAAGLGRKLEDGSIKAERIPHDFRRTAVRNLVRAGVPERVAMEMTGHRTRAVFERYNIVSEADHERAATLYDQRLEAERNHLADGHNSGTIAKLPTATRR